MRTTLGLGVVNLIALIGCGHGSKPSISTNKGNVCDQIAQVACYDMYQCCAEGEIERFLGVSDPRTEAECRDDVRRMCDRRFANVDSSLAASRVTFDSSVMNKCLQALLAPDNTCATVGATLPWTTACMHSAWAGAVANSGACSFSYECTGTGTSYCAPNETCTPLPTDGMQCAPGGCATGFYCSAGTCRAQSGPGGACSFGQQQCKQDLYCDFTTGQCAARHAAGEKCTGFDSCRSGQCLPGTCVDTGQICFGDTQCNGHCANNGNFCQQDANCGSGTCSVTTTKTCFFPSDCLPADGVCVYPNRCVHATCAGDVCAAAHVTVDYCTGALYSLPLPP